jgi:hypothetical protein
MNAGRRLVKEQRERQSARAAQMHTIKLDASRLTIRGRLRVVVSAAHTAYAGHGEHPGPTPADSYFLLACADQANAVIETNKANNCTPSSTTMAVTP